MSDEELIAAYYRGDDEAFVEIWRRYLTRLEEFFRKGGLTEEDAKDRAQDVFVRVMETKHPPPGSQAKPYDSRTGVKFKTWLFKIAINLLINTRRCSGHTVNFGALGAGGEEEEGESFEDMFPPQEERPIEEQVLAQQRRQDVRDCMETLPERERVAIALWLETDGGMTLKYLADVLGVSVPTAYRVLKRAFHLMRECLERKGGSA